MLSCFNLQFLNEIWCGKSFIMLICLLCIFFGKVSIHAFCSFKKSDFSFFGCWFLGALCIFSVTFLSFMDYTLGVVFAVPSPDLRSSRFSPLKASSFIILCFCLDLLRILRYLWLFSCFSNVCWERLFSLIVLISVLCQRQFSYLFGSVFWDHFSVSLFVLSLILRSLTVNFEVLQIYSFPLIFSWLLF